MADVADARAWVVTNKTRRQRERVDLERDAFVMEFVGDDTGDQFLLELADVEKLDADAGVVEPIDGFTLQREKILVRQLDLDPKFVADEDILFPPRKTPADADLL